MSFTPPFCPHRTCPHHDRDHPSEQRWWVRIGSYPNAHCGAQQRYRCKACGHTFSPRTFSVEYAVKRPLDLQRLVRCITSASGIRDIAREFAVSEKVVLNRLARLARQAIGLSATLRRTLRLREDLVADGFESFVASQYFPHNITLLVGMHSQYLYGIDYAQLRRKGRMTEGQKRRSEELDRCFPIPSGELTRSFTRIVSLLTELWRTRPTPYQLCLHTDEHRVYRRVLACDRELSRAASRGLFSHLRTSSKLPRTTANPLMSVNYYDREIRKDQANHVRETVQWSRDVNNCMDRMWLYAAWHNCWKRWRINSRDPATHAEHAGLEREVVEPEKQRFFTRRYFFSRLHLSGSEWMSWLRGWSTPDKRIAPLVQAYVLA
jgi:transposase-like protein